ncbi:MAG TPA: SPFH domain-containing protein [Kofleriaceae bacterium]|nr:SPFH domain-containing protein [Kofleriaceae bacterium]
MRPSQTTSEVARLVTPLARVLDAAWRRMHWWLAAMVVLYALSGIRVIRSGEVGVVLHWGRAIGGTHGPGAMYALPWPIDEVVRAPVKQISELQIDTLRDTPQFGPLDPVKQGYALTGDHNIVHVQIVAHYRVRDPAAWAFYGPSPDDVLRTEVTAAMVRSLGEMGVDRVLSDGRKQLVATATRRAQAGLDAAQSGLELTGLELTRLVPPAAVARDFDAVQSAFIGAETAKKQAQAYAQAAVPAAQAGANQAVQTAHAEAAGARGRADSDARAFVALAEQVRQNPVVVRERLYREGVEQAIWHATTRWVPPPVGARYSDLRIELERSDVGPAHERPSATPSRPTTPPRASDEAAPLQPPGED